MRRTYSIASFDGKKGQMTFIVDHELDFHGLISASG